MIGYAESSSAKNKIISSYRCFDEQFQDQTTYFHASTFKLNKFQFVRRFGEYTILKISYPYLPTTPSLVVIRKLLTYPLIDLAQGHLLFERAVDCERDQVGIRVRRFAFAGFVLLCLLVVQSRVRIER